MSETTALVRATADGGVLSVSHVLGRMDAIGELMQAAMKDGLDYGKIPGTGGKPTLLKPGAEKLCVMFCLAPEYRTDKTFHGDGHLTVECYCTILHAHTQAKLGCASAMCSTRESKYAYRRAERACPACGKAAVIKGKAEYGGGWLCWKKKDGCGATWPDGAVEIEGQPVGRVANPDLPDSYNTVLRIAEKRALVAAVRQVTGASAIFDEEHPEAEADASEHAAPAEAPRQAARPPARAAAAPAQQPAAAPAKPAGPKASPEQIARIGELLTYLHGEKAEAQSKARLARMGRNSIKELSAGEAETAISRLEAECDQHSAAQVIAQDREESGGDAVEDVGVQDVVTALQSVKPMWATDEKYLAFLSGQVIEREWPPDVAMLTQAERVAVLASVSNTLAARAAKNGRQTAGAA